MALGTPFYAALADELVADVEAGGPTWDVLAPFAHAPYEDAYVLRMLGGVHRMVLSGAAPALARHFPSTGGDGDASAAIVELRAVLRSRPDELLDALSRPPQTNEVGRAAALTSGLLVVAENFRRPVRVREIGSSGGLNLRLDSYWYGQDGSGWGAAHSPVRFVDLWQGGSPPFGADLQIVERRGCDRDPVDVTTDEGAVTTLSYIWPEPAERFVRARDAIEIAGRTEGRIDRADVAEWLGAQLAPVAGTALVIYHSVVWQYLDATTRDAVWAMISEAGRQATPDTPVAWLRLEPTPDTYVPARLLLNMWDGAAQRGDELLLATTGFHGGVMNWLAR